jgi:hypothetical protein
MLRCRAAALCAGLVVVGCSPSEEAPVRPTEVALTARPATIPLGPPPATDKLSFVVFGDVRPGGPNEDTQYPQAIFAKVMDRAAATSATFAVATGDYMFSTSASSVTNQVTQLLAAEAHFAHPIYHSLGNHECAGFTDSNCPNGTETPNMRAYMMQLIPFSPLPYYSFDVPTAHGVAKFVFVAANAWSDDQASWLATELARPTDYTFVIRHEPPGNTQAPGAAPSDTLMRQNPLTLGLYGHIHVYKHVATNQIISGNAGAPLDGGSYGIVWVEQQDDGTIEVREIKESSGQVGDHFRVSPTGASVADPT